MIPTRILMADDHAIFRQGLRKLLEEHREFSIVGEASNGSEVMAAVNSQAPDVLLLDLQLGDMTGLDVLRRIGTGVNFKTILLGADIQRADELNAILLGASGIVRKYAASETLFKSIESVLEGEMWVKRDIMKDLVGIMRGPRSSFGDSSGNFGLTGRELEIV